MGHVYPIIWVCLKIVYPIVPNGFADHYPYEKWLFHWEYTQHFQTNPLYACWSWLPSDMDIATIVESRATKDEAMNARSASLTDHTLHKLRMDSRNCFRAWEGPDWTWETCTFTL